MSETLQAVRAEARALERIRAEEREARKRLRDAILEARESGHSLAQIGEALGLSRQRVQQLSR